MLEEQGAPCGVALHTKSGVSWKDHVTLPDFEAKLTYGKVLGGPGVEEAAD